MKEIDKKLFDAVKTCNTDDVVACLKKGADVDARNEDGDTPLHIACERNDAETVKVLYNYGALTTRYDSEGLKPIQRARFMSSAYRALLKESFLERGYNSLDM